MHGDGERAEPGPLVIVELVDGQQVRAEFLGRIRQPSGDWWCELRLTLWAQAQLPDQTIAAAPSSVAFRAPAARVTPIEGTDYSAVPTRRAGPPVRDRLAAELTGKWFL
ncbi:MULTISPECIES: hypothetical protein [Streptomyces]|uniref:Uncharacterized protein n=1 Tax=Streptomyces luteosporeus TaxID=173856 RepID=A0ABP6GAL5_9ACTN